MPILQINNLTKQFGSDQTGVFALKSILFEVQEGEFVAITGKSGSGKSTLLNLIAGLDSATMGRIVICGRDITSISEKEMSEFRCRNIGMVFQFFNLVPELTVEENIFLPVQLAKNKPDRDFAGYLIDRMGLTERRVRYSSVLSGGEQQRVAIARALINRPKLLLLDEPTGNLDSETSESVLKIIEEIRRELNQTVIMVTHEPDYAARADRIITLRSGEIVSDTGTTG